MANTPTTLETSGWLNRLVDRIDQQQNPVIFFNRFDE